MTDARTKTQQTLIIQTVYFAEGDRAAAVELGDKLYEALTRPPSEPLAFGPGIPVIVGSSAEHVDLHAAEHLLILPVLGQGSFQDEAIRGDACVRLAAWHEALRDGHVVPVFDAPAWLDEAGQLPGVPIRARVVEDGDATWTATVISVALAACRLIGDAGKPPQIFLSHAKRDLAATDRLAEQLAAYIRKHTTGTAFFDATDLAPGHPLSAQLAEAVGRGVFVAVLGDSYASRPWCESEMLGAKRSGAPTLAIHVLQHGELRSYPYSGNGPTVVWKPGSGVEHIALRAIVEWLRYRHFALDAERRFRDDVPWLIPLPRPPELLDLAQGPLLESAPTVVMHPDPEVSRHEREVLRQARPRMRLVTPSTFYRGLELRDGGSRCTTAPLCGREIALSVSNSPDACSAVGFTCEHVTDAIVFLSRALISGGAAVAYGGDLRFGGYDELLAELIRTYNASGQDRARYLISYQPATMDPAEPGAVRRDLPLTVRSLRTAPGLREAVRLPVPPALSPSALPALLRTLSAAERVEVLVSSAIYLGDMRRLMSANSFARVALGGQAHPQKDGATAGYIGAYPGAVEEAWWTLAAERPLYIAGGFGGAAGALAALFEGDAPAVLQPGAFVGAEYSEYRRRAAAFEASPLRAQVQAPGNLEELARNLQVRAAQLLASDDSARAWNGLTRDDNGRLFHSRDRIEITQLVMRGLYQKCLASAAGKLRIELLRGDILQVEAVDAIAIATYRNVPIGGAAAAIDRAMSSAVTAARHAGRSVIPVPTPEIDADWLVITELCELVAGDLAILPGSIERCAARVAEVVVRNGFRKLAIVTFGSSTHGALDDVVARMLAGFAKLPDRCTLQWFERDRAVYERLAGLLDNRGDVELSRRELLDVSLIRRPAAALAVRDVVLTTRYADGAVHATILPPEGAAVAMALTTPFDTAQFNAVARPTSGAAPRATLDDAVGEAVVTAILGPHGRDVLRTLRAHRLVIQHDTETAMLPFEMFTVGDHRFGLENGVIRRPVLSDVPLQLPRPVRRGALQLMLIVDPRLAEAVDEAEAVEKAVKVSANVVVHQLVGAAATRDAMLAALRDPAIDVFHHCGHAFYDGPEPAQSGLVCPSGERLTGQDIAAFDALPRIAFFNACRSGRLRRMEPANATPDGTGLALEPIYTRAFAAYFLRGGVDAYVGTLWPVRDDAAALFAASVYTELSRGATLDKAVCLARRVLRERTKADWANYVLYGDGSFSIVK
jgi:hypothetical protein